MQTFGAELVGNGGGRRSATRRNAGPAWWPSAGEADAETRRGHRGRGARRGALVVELGEALKTCTGARRLELAWPLGDAVALVVGARNVLSTYPDMNPNAGRLGNPYPPSTPFGFDGGFYYTRLDYRWGTAD